MLGVAGLLWWRRHRLSERELPATNPQRLSSAILGATIAAVELPTVLPYFTAITAIVGSGSGTTRQLVPLVAVNVCFVLPLIAIVGMLAFAGDGAAVILSRTRDRLHADWPAVLAALALLASVVLLGVSGLSAHGDFSKSIHDRRFRQQLG